MNSLPIITDVSLQLQDPLKKVYIISSDDKVLKSTKPQKLSSQFLSIITDIWTETLIEKLRDEF